MDYLGVKGKRSLKGMGALLMELSIGFLVATVGKELIFLHISIKLNYKIFLAICILLIKCKRVSCRNTIFIMMRRKNFQNYDLLLKIRSQAA